MVQTRSQTRKQSDFKFMELDSEIEFDSEKEFESEIEFDSEKEFDSESNSDISELDEEGVCKELLDMIVRGFFENELVCETDSLKNVFLKKKQLKDIDRGSLNEWLQDPKMYINELLEYISKLDTIDLNKEMMYSMVNKISVSSSEDINKYTNWLDCSLRVPYGVYIESKGEKVMIDKMCEIRKRMDADIMFMDIAKDKIITLLPRLLENKSLNALALYGEKGTGKSTIARVIADALGRPFKMISLGGENDASSLMGHNMTYTGSHSGMIINTLISSKCMNPVILIDELDKISQTHNGGDVTGFLTHLVDTTTNMEFNGDKFLSGLTFDISKILFIFTYNDSEKINKVLEDRLTKIYIPDYSVKERREIVMKKMLPLLLRDFLFAVELSESALSKLCMVEDTGLRMIKQLLSHMLSRVQILLLSSVDSIEDLVKLKYKTLHKKYQHQFQDSGKVIIDVSDMTLLLEGVRMEDPVLARNKFSMYT